MIRRVFFLLVMLSITLVQYGQVYAVDRIPSELKRNADAVIRTWETRFDIENREMASYQVKKAITVLNDDGSDWGEFVEAYDKLDKIRRIKIAIYNASGKLVKKVKSGEIEDIGYTSAGSVYDDSRLKAYVPYGIEAPYTVEVEFEKLKKSSLFYPRWNMRRASGISVQHASLVVNAPYNYDIRYRQEDYEGEPQITKQNGVTNYLWQIQNLPALKREFRGPGVSLLSPRVILAPKDFSMEGYAGSMETWKDFGLWIKQLNANRDQLPAQLAKEINDLVKDAPDDLEKIRRIYSYLQSNTRYVSIQLGIGGFQPFEASNVAENGYGDCKALTNFTYSMLKNVGIKSFYTLIRAGDNADDIITDFPSSQFNHVILSVPLEKDTVWLECTSQQAPFNFLGGFTSDRHGLMITENGGVLVKTPEYTAEQNAQLRKIEIDMDAEGNAQAKVFTRYKGRQYDDNYFLASRGKEDQRKFLLNTIDIPAFDLGEFKYEEEKSENPELTEEFDLSLRKYASTTGKRLFFIPNLLSRYSSTPPKDEDRKSAIINRYNYKDIDTVVFRLPEDYRLEFQPDPVDVVSEFGEYKVSYDFNPETNELTYVRYIKVFKGTFPANSYADFRSFWRKVSRSDKSKLVLIGST